MSFIKSFAVKKYSDLKMVNFLCTENCFHGDTFVAREHNTNGIFHF